MDKTHTGFLPSAIATIAFMIPAAYLYAVGYNTALFIYAFVVIYLLINGFSSKRWASELDRRAWVVLYTNFKQKIFKAHKQKAPL